MVVGVRVSWLFGMLWWWVLGHHGCLGCCGVGCWGIMVVLDVVVVGVEVPWLFEMLWWWVLRYHGCLRCCGGGCWGIMVV